MKPIIGITKNKKQYSTDSLNNYVRAVTRFGGEPRPLEVNIAEVKKLAREIDGLLLTGGPDIDPKCYREKEIHAAGLDICPMDRTDFDFAMFREMLKLGKPVLGICLGIQEMNVYFGGSLHQDMPSHSQVKGKDAVHKVDIKAGTILGGIVNAGRITVNSSHHQAVKAVGKGLVASAVSADGYVEGLELPGAGFVVGVQWHPERMWSDRVGTYAGRLFRAFIERCR